MDEAERIAKELYYKRGRPVSVNKQTLNVRPGKNYAELMFWGDVHWGYPSCLIDKAVANLEYCVKKGVYVLGMGDYLECGLTNSIGDSVYHQRLNPQEQMEDMIEILRPVANAGLLVGLYHGNHESRILKNTSINITKIMCHQLGVPYLLSARWNYFKVGNILYKVYGQHGKTGSRFAHTKLKAATDAVSHIKCDVGAYGHVHDMISNVVEEQDIDPRNRKIIVRRKLIVVTGHYLGWDMSYAQEAGMSIGKVGSPKIELHADKKSVHMSH